MAHDLKRSQISLVRASIAADAKPAVVAKNFCIGRAAVIPPESKGLRK
jgi:hypothetical protein